MAASAASTNRSAWQQQQQQQPRHAASSSARTNDDGVLSLHGVNLDIALHGRDRRSSVTSGRMPHTIIRAGPHAPGTESRPRGRLMRQPSTAAALLPDAALACVKQPAGRLHSCPSADATPVVNASARNNSSQAPAGRARPAGRTARSCPASHTRRAAHACRGGASSRAVAGLRVDTLHVSA